MRSLPIPSNITVKEVTEGWIRFFIWQAAAITFEDFVQWIWRKLGGRFDNPTLFRTTIGYIWVACSLWYSLPWVGDIVLRLRVHEETFLPYTVFGLLTKYVSIPP